MLFHFHLLFVLRLAPFAIHLIYFAAAHVMPLPAQRILGLKCTHLLYLHILLDTAPHRAKKKKLAFCGMWDFLPFWASTAFLHSLVLTRILQKRERTAATKVVSVCVGVPCGVLVARLGAGIWRLSGLVVRCVGCGGWVSARGCVLQLMRACGRLVITLWSLWKQCCLVVGCGLWFCLAQCVGVGRCVSFVR
jgi:hypothetical protein